MGPLEIPKNIDAQALINKAKILGCSVLSDETEAEIFGAQDKISEAQGDVRRADGEVSAAEDQQHDAESESDAAQSKQHDSESKSQGAPTKESVAARGNDAQSIMSASQTRSQSMEAAVGVAEQQNSVFSGSLDAGLGNIDGFSIEITTLDQENQALIEENQALAEELNQESTFDGTGEGVHSAYSLSTATEVEEDQQENPEQVTQGSDNSAQATINANNAKIAENGARTEEITQQAQSEQQTISDAQADAEAQLEEQQAAAEAAQAENEDSNSKLDEIGQMAETASNIGGTIDAAGDAVKVAGTAVQTAGGVLTAVGTGVGVTGGTITGVGGAITAIGAPLCALFGIGVPIVGAGGTTTGSGVGVTSAGTSVGGVGSTLTSTGGTVKKVGEGLSVAGNAIKAVGDGTTAYVKAAQGDVAGAIQSTMGAISSISSSVATIGGSSEKVASAVNKVVNGAAAVQSGVATAQSIANGDTEGAIANGISTITYGAAGAFGGKTADIAKKVQEGTAAVQSGIATYKSIEEGDTKGAILNGLSIVGHGYGAGGKKYTDAASHLSNALSEISQASRDFEEGDELNGNLNKTRAILHILSGVGSAGTEHTQRSAQRIVDNHVQRLSSTYSDVDASSGEPTTSEDVSARTTRRADSEEETPSSTRATRSTDSEGETSTGAKAGFYRSVDEMVDDTFYDRERGTYYNQNWNNMTPEQQQDYAEQMSKSGLFVRSDNTPMSADEITAQMRESALDVNGRTAVASGAKTKDNRSASAEETSTNTLTTHRADSEEEAPTNTRTTRRADSEEETPTGTRTRRGADSDEEAPSGTRARRGADSDEEAPSSTRATRSTDSEGETSTGAKAGFYRSVDEMVDDTFYDRERGTYYNQNWKNMTPEQQQDYVRQMSRSGLMVKSDGTRMTSAEIYAQMEEMSGFGSSSRDDMSPTAKSKGGKAASDVDTPTTTTSFYSSIDEMVADTFYDKDTGKYYNQNWLNMTPEQRCEYAEQMSKSGLLFKPDGTPMSSADVVSYMRGTAPSRGGQVVQLLDSKGKLFTPDFAEGLVDITNESRRILQENTATGQHALAGENEKDSGVTNYGVFSTHKKVKDMGFDGTDFNGDVSLVQEAQALATAAYGSVTIEEVRDADGNVVMDAYGNAKIRVKDTGSNGWTEVSRVEGLVERDGELVPGGFHAKAYQKNGNLIIAFRGSDDAGDLDSDRQLLSGRRPEQLDDAIDFVQRMRKRYPEAKIIVTGHSLGGALTELTASHFDDVLGISFNAVGTQRVVENSGGTLKDNHNTINYIIRGDEISNASRHVGSTVVMEASANPRFTEHAIQQFDNQAFDGVEAGMVEHNVRRASVRPNLECEIRFSEAPGQEVSFDKDQFKIIKREFEYDVNTYGADLDRLEAQIEKVNDPKQQDELRDIIAKRRTQLKETTDLSGLQQEVRGGVARRQYKHIAHITETMRSRQINELLSEQYGISTAAFGQSDGTPAARVVFDRETTMVRVFNDKKSFARGLWIMAYNDIKGLTPQQIKDKFALPELPTYVTEIHVPAGAEFATGTCRPVKGWGKGGGNQYFFLGGNRPTEYGNMRRLPGA